MPVLDSAVRAMQADATLKINIEGSRHRRRARHQGGRCVSVPERASCIDLAAANDTLKLQRLLVSRDRDAWPDVDREMFKTTKAVAFMLQLLDGAATPIPALMAQVPARLSR
jgi:hypothetical protein